MILGERLVPIWLDVSRETLERLIELEAIVLKWTLAVNLISKSSIPGIWSRHILDSAQIGVLSGGIGARSLDIGSGGGFPALVLATMSKDLAPGAHFTLIESDARKSAFLRQAIQELDLQADVVVGRIEEVQPFAADVLTARALAPLTELLAHGRRHLLPDGRAFFPKGASHMDEVAEARKKWRFELSVHDSKTENAAAVLEVAEIELL